MRQALTSLAASGVIMALMALIAASSEVAGFALYVTIRNIARIHLPYLEYQVAGLVLAIVLLGEVLKRASGPSADVPAWGQRWLWVSVVVTSGAGVTVASVDALRRGLNLGGGLFEIAWAGITLGLLAIASLIGQSCLERGGTALWNRALGNGHLREAAEQ